MPQVPSRSETIRARVTPAEKAAAEAAADRRGLKLSDHVRERVLRTESGPGAPGVASPAGAESTQGPTEPLAPIASVPDPEPAEGQMHEYLTGEQWDREVRGAQSRGMTRPAAAADVRSKFGPRPDEAA